MKLLVCRSIACWNLLLPDISAKFENVSKLCAVTVNQFGKFTDYRFRLFLVQSQFLMVEVMGAGACYTRAYCSEMLHSDFPVGFVPRRLGAPPHSSI